MAQFKPEVLDKLDEDEAIQAYAEAVGLPPTVLKSEDEVLELREARQQAQQAQAEAEDAAQSAETAKNVAEIEATPDNLAGQLQETLVDGEGQ